MADIFYVEFALYFLVYNFAGGGETPTASKLVILQISLAWLFGIFLELSECYGIDKTRSCN